MTISKEQNLHAAVFDMCFPLTFELFVIIRSNLFSSIISFIKILHQNITYILKLDSINENVLKNTLQRNNSIHFEFPNNSRNVYTHVPTAKHIRLQYCNTNSAKLLLHYSKL